jgi:hypothetical protein
MSGNVTFPSPRNTSDATRHTLTCFLATLDTSAGHTRRITAQVHIPSCFIALLFINFIILVRFLLIILVRFFLLDICKILIKKK